MKRLGYGRGLHQPIGVIFSVTSHRSGNRFDIPDDEWEKLMQINPNPKLKIVVRDMGGNELSSASHKSVTSGTEILMKGIPANQLIEVEVRVE